MDLYSISVHDHQTRESTQLSLSERLGNDTGTSIHLSHGILPCGEEESTVVGTQLGGMAKAVC